MNANRIYGLRLSFFDNESDTREFKKSKFGINIDNYFQLNQHNGSLYKKYNISMEER